MIARPSRASLVARLVCSLAALVVLATAHLPVPPPATRGSLRQAPAAEPSGDLAPFVIRVGFALAIGAALGLELSRRRAWH